jgi:outer membrane lipoprotein SlyB
MQIKIRQTLGIFVTVLLLCSACAAGPKRPRFFPNDHYRRVGPGVADADAAQCMALADEYVENPSAWQDVATRGAGGAVIGAGAGALTGTITKGKVGRTTAAGAAVGSIVGVASGLSKMGERNPSYDRFVEHCLQQKGYQVVGWEN